MEEQACGCDSKNLTEKGTKDGYVYYTCKDCGNSFGVPQRTERGAWKREDK